MFDDWNWRLWLLETLKYAGENPWTFVYYVLLALSPFFLLSAFLAYQLAKQIDAKEKEKKKRAKREANIGKSRRAKSD